MQLTISKTFWFEAGHFFGHKPEEHPYRRMHGHSYLAEVGLNGAVSEETGWVEDMAHVGEVLEGVRTALDHRLLNEIEGLENPSLENLALWIARRLKDALPGLAYVKVGRPSTGEACTVDVTV